ncbi:MAG: hypothetical protein IID17_10720 [Nitrospinae bacterium]|nr:hypothetical protein [Nitrospinota bacterium]
MKQPCYINLEQARLVLADLGVELSARQMKRAAQTDATGKRKLPFFVDPIENKLKIEKGTLVTIYRKLQIEAENSAKH